MGFTERVRLTPLPTIRELLQLYRLNALKKLSQNFLLNLHLTGKIVKSAGEIKNSEVCEIGPGPGGITRSILVKNPKRVIVIEKDKRFKPMLESLASCSPCKFDIVYADILDFDFTNIFDETYRKNWDDKSPLIHLIGNLPFNVSTFLIINWLKDISLKRSAWSYGRVRMTLTFQEEVAERMVAPILSKKRCRMSVMCQNWCKVHHAFTILGNAFLPKPDVNVGVVTFEPLVQPIIPLEFHLVEKVTRTIFHNRQKYCEKPASLLFPEELRESLTKELFEISQINPTTRSFQITNEEWGRICFAYKHICDRDPRLYSYNFRSEASKRDSWKDDDLDEGEGHEDEENEKKEEEVDRSGNNDNMYQSSS